MMPICGYEVEIQAKRVEGCDFGSIVFPVGWSGCIFVLEDRQMT